MKNCSIFIKDKDIILMSSHRMRDTSVSHICHERYLNSRLAGFVERSRRRAQSRRIPESISLRAHREEAPLVPVPNQSDGSSWRCAYRSFSGNELSRAMTSASESPLLSSLRDQFVEVEERYGEG